MEHYDAVGSYSRTMDTEESNQLLESNQNGRSPGSDSEDSTGPDVYKVTPHKRAKYLSPEKDQSSRKRKSTPALWKRNVRKRNTNYGKEYTNEKGKDIPARCMKAIDCSKCRFKCSAKIDEETRQSIFTSYWDLGNYERQRHFICQNSVTVKPQRRRQNVKNMRHASHQHYFDTKM